MRARTGRRPMLSVLLVPVILVVAVCVSFAFEVGDPVPGAAVEAETPCSADSDVARAVFLMDLRKPLDPVHAALPGALVRQTATGMDAGTELAVYALSPHAEAPRTLLGRLCKTIDLAGLVAKTSKHDAADDCDLPVQAPADARARAKDFCRQRDALVRRIDTLATGTLGRPAGPAYLLEALEATARELGATPDALHVFSDLMQHSPWYSHVETPSDDWDYERMAATWAAQPMEEPLRGFAPETTVRLHYVPRIGKTVAEETRAAHLRFWTSYFDGAEIAVDYQPAMADYLPESLVEEPAIAERAAYELERLRHSSAQVERERAEISRERAELRQERTKVNRERSDLDNARRELEAEQERLAIERRKFDDARRRFDAQGRDPADDAPIPSEDLQNVARRDTGDGP